MSILVVGTNHKYSPIQIREQLSFSKKRLKEALVSLVDLDRIKAAVILSTCNRVELYADAQNTEEGARISKEFLPAYHNQDWARIEPYLYTYTGREAILHLFKVASGLDSQLIGENQILEQVRFAYQEARSIEATDKLLDIVFNNALRVALRVRQETGIAKGKVSIGSMVIGLIKKICGDIKDKIILIIGVGKICELVVNYLKPEKLNSVFIANRTYAKAKVLADSISTEVVRFDRLQEKLKEADIIISATSSPHLILKKEDILEAINYQSSTINYKLIIDLAVPRDVDPEVKYIRGIYLFDLDDLSFLIEKNLEKRKKAIPFALKIIEEEVEDLCLREPLELELERVCLP